MFPIAEALRAAAATAALAGADATKDVQGVRFTREMRQYKPSPVYREAPLSVGTLRERLAETEGRRKELERLVGHRG